jgi:hypothetical protein
MNPGDIPGIHQDTLLRDDILARFLEPRDIFREIGSLLKPDILDSGFNQVIDYPGYIIRLHADAGSFDIFRQFAYSPASPDSVDFSSRQVHGVDIVAPFHQLFQDSVPEFFSSRRRPEQRDLF